eukprot:6466991-Amphidinium_carterae.2
MMQLYVSDPYNLSYNLPAIVQLPVHLDVREVEHVIDIFTQRHTVFRSAYRYGSEREMRAAEPSTKRPGGCLVPDCKSTRRSCARLSTASDVAFAGS